MVVLYKKKKNLYILKDFFNIYVFFFVFIIYWVFVFVGGGGGLWVEKLEYVFV